MDNTSLRQKLESIKGYLPSQYVDTIFDELNRVNGYSDESRSRKQRLELIANLPWTEDTSQFLSNTTIQNMSEILDEEHYGMFSVKDRFLDIFSRMLHNNQISSFAPILLHGPPGVGKTSFVSSVAKALHRKTFKIALGGLDDELELKGCSISYNKAQPGIIIRNVERLGTFSPVIHLDEIDKLGKISDASNIEGILLDMLDNDRTNFMDLYLDIPIDLSNAIFIATANNIEDIRPSLLDRMQIIEIPGYSPSEKKNIVRHYFLKKELATRGLDHYINEIYNFINANDLISRLVTITSSEAGVRKLNELVQILLDKITRLIVEHGENWICHLDEVNHWLNSRNTTYIYKQENSYFTRQPTSTQQIYTVSRNKEGVGFIVPLEVMVQHGIEKDSYSWDAKSRLNYLGQLVHTHIFEHRKKYKLFADDFFETNSLYTNVVFDYINSETITEDIYSYGLALYLCTLSAISGIPLKKNIVAVGGFSLTGNIFAISNAVEKALIADNLGYEILLFPKANEIDFLNYYKQSKEALKLKDNLIFCDTLDDAILASFSIRPNYLFPFN